MSRIDSEIYKLAAVLYLSVFLTIPSLEAATTSVSGSAAESPTNSMENLEVFNFNYGVSAIGIKMEDGSKCGQELEEMLNAFQNEKLWALKVFNSFGSIPSAFIWGNYFWFPSRELCEDLNDPYSITFSEKVRKANQFNMTSPFPMQFSVVYMNFTTPYFVDLKLDYEIFIHVGLCLPASCGPEAILNSTQMYFDRNVFKTQAEFQIKLETLDIKTPKFSWSFFTKIGTIIFFTLFFVVLVLSILAEMNRRSQEKRKYVPDLSSSSPDNLVSSSTKLEKYVSCFCLYTNWKQIKSLEVSSSGSYLSCIAGLKTIICLWITVFHVYYYSLYALTNVPLLFAKLEQLAFQPVVQACFYVDVFFLISAFLLVHNFLSNKKQLESIKRNSLGGNMKMILRSIFKRYMRLTPIVGITMLISNMVSDFLNIYSPFQLGTHSGIYCKTNWWYNLLYIQNFLDMKDICCSWTWYLACEMQYFLLFTILLYTYAKDPKIATTIYLIVTVGLVAVAWLWNYRHGISFQIDVIHSTLSKVYVKPWVRILPYLGGVAMGWLTVKCQNKTEYMKNPYDCCNNSNKNDTYNMGNNLPYRSAGKSGGSGTWIWGLGGIKLKRNVNSIFSSFKMSFDKTNANMQMDSKPFSRKCNTITIATTNSNNIESNNTNNGNNNGRNNKNIKDKIKRTCNKSIGGNNMNNSKCDLNTENSFECQINGSNKGNANAIDNIYNNNNKNSGNNFQNPTCNTIPIRNETSKNSKNAPNASNESNMNSIRKTRTRTNLNSINGSITRNASAISAINTTSNSMQIITTCNSNSNSNSNSNGNSNSTTIGTTKRMKTTIQLNVVWLVAYWFVCICFYVATNFMSYWRNTPIWLVSTIMSLGKLLFSLCCGGIILLCSIGYASPFNSFLSARLFIFFNRFTYSMYMIAPAIVFAVFGLRNVPITFDEVSSGTDFIAVIMTGFVAALLMVLLIELPFQNLTDVILQKSKMPKSMEEMNKDLKQHATRQGHTSSKSNSIQSVV